MSARKWVRGKREPWGLSGVRCPSCGLTFAVITKHREPVAVKCHWCRFKLTAEGPLNEEQS